jgi:hypothetical protein
MSSCNRRASALEEAGRQERLIHAREVELTSATDALHSAQQEIRHGAALVAAANDALAAAQPTDMTRQQLLAAQARIEEVHAEIAQVQNAAAADAAAATATATAQQETMHTHEKELASVQGELLMAATSLRTTRAEARASAQARQVDAQRYVTITLTLTLTLTHASAKTRQADA